MMRPRSRSSSRTGGCLQIVLISAAVLFALACLGGWYAYKNGPRWMREGTATLVEAGSEAMFESLKLTPEQRAAAMGPVKDFAGKIRNEEIGIEDAQGIMAELEKGPARGVLMSLGFIQSYLKASKLAEEAKAAAEIAAMRFANGLATGRIPADRIGAIDDIVIQRSAHDSSQQGLKPTLTDRELEQVVAVMTAEAEAAGVGPDETSVDVAQVLREAIDRGLARSRSPAVPAPAPAPGEPGPSPDAPAT